MDATSDDGLHGLTLIGFVGSVFSPYYAWARRRGPTPAENHCALNVALYGKKRRWAMTERSARDLTRTAQHIRIGPSSMSWQGGDLVIRINERCAPLPLPLVGEVRITPAHVYDTPMPLDDAGHHHWQAVAPLARASVQLAQPELCWSGSAYHDMNWGDEPLERGFKQWTWMRAQTENGTQVIYDLERRDGSNLAFGRCFAHGQVSERAIPPLQRLRNGFWGMERQLRADAAPRLLATLEDAPFYTRNHIEILLDGKPCDAYHESLSLGRFESPLVQMMLPFRMPRRG